MDLPDDFPQFTVPYDRSRGLIFPYPRPRDYGIRKTPCCVRDEAFTFWANKYKQGSDLEGDDAIGWSQGEISS
jgi:hypothetical protein